jgi:hypothetical protein
MRGTQRQVCQFNRTGVGIGAILEEEEEWNHVQKTTEKEKRKDGGKAGIGR